MWIEDDFLDQKEFDKLQDLMLSPDFAWYYNPTIDFENTLGDKFQFIHFFYKAFTPTSSNIKIINPVLAKIDAVSLWRIKANLLTKTSNIIENEFHVDMDMMSEEKQKQWTTSIFYINTNNGYTEFQDGRIAMENTKVESVANRMVTFPANLKHYGTSCTDEKTRVVINFNYFK